VPATTAVVVFPLVPAAPPVIVVVDPAGDVGVVVRELPFVVMFVVVELEAVLVDDELNSVGVD
jgi:hypothetical protein